MKVLVCIDLSPLSERVVQEAASLASMTGASIELLHVVRCAQLPDGDQLEPPGDLEYRVSELDAMAARVRSSGAAAESHVKLCREPVHSFVIGEAVRGKANLILVGSHGRGKTFELFVGSVTHAVIREATVPVVVVNGLQSMGGPG